MHVARMWADRAVGSATKITAVANAMPVSPNTLASPREAQAMPAA